jgi:hypothetical protein
VFVLLDKTQATGPTNRIEAEMSVEMRGMDAKCV